MPFSLANKGKETQNSFKDSLMPCCAAQNSLKDYLMLIYVAQNELPAS